MEKVEAYKHLSKNTEIQFLINFLILSTLYCTMWFKWIFNIKNGL